ncbi:transglutaminase-like domain-containing protein [bacterium]|nr:transglutaminase-like domain-containing protein [bacterium]
MSVFGSDANSSSVADRLTLWDLPAIPEQETDIGYWALVIARECDSTIDIDHYLRALDSMAARIRYMVGPRDGDMVRFVMTQMYQFEPGEWNGDQVFSYDFDDPLGQESGARLLTTYLDTHKGNCVSMPTLFLALMERVDPTIPFYGVASPMHLFCRLHDRQDGKVWNVEATNGGNSVRDEWIRTQYGVSQIAIDSGSYLRELTKKEYIAELIGILISKHRRAGEYEKANRLADLILELNPRSLLGLVQKGALLGWLGQTMQEQIVTEGRRPTVEEDEQLRLYQIESERYIKRARSLGWEPETRESRERYLRTVREAGASERE